MVTSVFPEYEWKPWLFAHVPRNFWSKESNRREFMDWLGKQLGYEKKEDWYRVSIKDIVDNGGYGVLGYYGNSPSTLVTNVYNEHTWHMWRFHTAPKGFNENLKNGIKSADMRLKIDSALQREFLEHIRHNEFIKKESDLLNVTAAQLSKYTSSLRWENSGKRSKIKAG